LFVDLGLKDAGYEYVNIDDCWSEKQRNETGHLVAEFAKFPDGMKHVIDQVHKLGLKIGIYSDAGTQTCAGYPGSLGHEAIDAETWAEWGFDYLKYDNCNVPEAWEDVGMPPGGDWYESNSAHRFRRMANALAAQSRPMEFSLCIWGRANVWEWGGRVGHSWRMFEDSQAIWYYIMSITQTNLQFLDYVDFYSHNDMDLLEIGNGWLTLAEQRSHFAIWAFLKSPILVSHNLAWLSPEQIAIVTNRELLAFNQDPVIGTPARPFHNAAGETISPPEFYSGNSTKGNHVFVVNTNGLPSYKTIHFASVPGLNGTKFIVHDMWTGNDLGTHKHNFTFHLLSHDTAAYLLKPVANDTSTA